MREGLLWYDDDPKHDLAEKIQRAVRRYRQKFGTSPDVCYVHPTEMDENIVERKVGQVHVACKPCVLQHHYWVGQEEK